MSVDEAAAKVAEPEVTDANTPTPPAAPPEEPVKAEAASPEVPATPAESSEAAAPAEPVAEAAPPAPVQPAAKEPAPEPAAETAPADAPKRRVKLNPTFTPGAAAAAATEATQAAPAQPEAAEASESTEQKPDEDKPAAAPAAEAKPADPPSKPPRPSAPVEIPRVDENLDAELEAELAAAMESGDLNKPTATAPVAKSDDETADAAEATPLPETEEELEVGQRLTGKIQSVHGDDVFLDVGYRSPGVVPNRQFGANRKPLVGQQIEVVFDKLNSDDGLIQLSLPRGVRRPAGNWESVSVGQVVECMVMKTNKGGLEVNVGNLRGFMPASQVDSSFVENLETFVGQKLQAEVTESNPKKRKLVVSRRKIIAAERAEQEAELWKTLSVGQNYPGKVKTVKNYGAFIDIGGIDGFLHIGEISHSHIRHPSDVLSEGQEVHVQVISLEPEKKKIGLGMKQLIADPWQAVSTNYPAESTVNGKVTRVADFGAFVQLEPGVEGLVHISEIDHSRVGRVADVLKVGQEIEAKVLEVDTDRNRISLSIKALKAAPEGKRDKDVPPESPAYVRKRTGPLKGGNSQDLSQGGGLFGNPNDFG